jgi:hypothetical protein
MAIELALIELHFPGKRPTLAGFFLHDGEHLEWRLLEEWSFIEDPVERMVLANTQPFLESLVAEHGAQRTLEMLEDLLSKVLRLSTRVELIQASGAIQHAGIALGIGDGAGHPGRSLFDSSYWPWLNSTREVSAVSGACLAVHRHIFEELGGFDETFPLNYNDVDFCLRARQAGHRVVLDADATLTHLEATTRKAGTHSAERMDFFRRWSHLLETPDPFYSPNLSPRFEAPALDF